MNATTPTGEAPIAIPITGELDLHTFDPRDVGELIPAYLEACLERGLRDVRIVHGKGTGTCAKPFMLFCAVLLESALFVSVTNTPALGAPRW